MADVSMIRMLRTTPLYEGGGEASSLGEDAAYQLERLTAERDRLADRVRQLERVIRRTREVIIDHFDDGCGECANAVALIDMVIATAEGR